MPDRESETGPEDAGAPRRKPLSPVGIALVAIGSVGVVAAMLVDGVAVIGRHTGAPLMGSIEMSQAAIIIMASCGVAFATLERAHAVVDLLHRRLGPKLGDIVLRAAALMGLMFMTCVIAGSVWIAADLWQGRERTELLEIPLQPLRILWIVCASVAAAGFVLQAIWPHAKKDAG